MTRLQADLALLFAGLIWGFGFVAQKTAFDNIGPYTFVAARFLLSALFVLPFVWYERGLKKLKPAIKSKRDIFKLSTLCGTCALAVILQQCGLASTTVTKTAFLTGLYVVMVPFAGALFFGGRLTTLAVTASLLSVAGVWFLAGGHTEDLNINLNQGDWLVILCAVSYAIQVNVLGSLAKKLQLPFTLSFLQYLTITVAALIGAILFEHIDLAALMRAWLPVLFAGIASGGIAYTLQAVAQQHTPTADAAIILSSEALFGGVGGIWLMHEPITANAITGCAAIMAAIMLVEMGPIINWGRNRRLKKP